MSKPIIGSARIDENGNIYGGKDGDQTGREVMEQNAYIHSKGWVLLRPADEDTAETIAATMAAACKNDKIGYNQRKRNTLYTAAEPYAFDVSQVAVKCATDCSALVRVCLAAAEIDVAANTRTANMVSRIVATGKFYKYTDDAYTKAWGLWRRGDILVTKTRGHTVVVLTDGDNAEQDYELGDRTLRKGSTGADVVDLQTGLTALGYDTQGIDGIFGVNTLAAVKAFQTAYGLEVDGVVGPLTTAALESALIAVPDDGSTDSEDTADDAAGEDTDTAAEGTAGEETVYPVRGIIPDISSNQGKIGLDKLAAGNDFAIFRVIRGNDTIDPQAVRNMSGCAERGFPFGVYYFFKLSSISEAEAMAEKMFAACDPYKPTVYFLDVEVLADGVSNARNKTYIKAYVAKLRELGVEKIGIYMGDYRWRRWYSSLVSVFDVLWIASWGQNTGFLSAIPKTRCGLHQYTSYGGARRNGIKVPGAPGVSTRVDLSRLTGNTALTWFTGRTHSGVEYPGIVRAKSKVNVRKGPGTGYAVLAAIPRGRYAIKRDGSVDGWQAVVYNGMDGYVSDKYLKAVSEA